MATSVGGGGGATAALAAQEAEVAATPPSSPTMREAPHPPSTITPTPTTTTDPASASYYDKGNVELAIETPVMRKRLEKRRRLTQGANTGAERLLIVLVGLPARGKSFIARKLLNYMLWRGNQCKIFNVGKYRRQLADHESSSNANACNADFFDESNQQAAKLRQQAAELALNETLKWLDGSNDTINPGPGVGEDGSGSLGSSNSELSLDGLGTERDDQYFINGHTSHW